MTKKKQSQRDLFLERILAYEPSMRLKNIAIIVPKRELFSRDFPYDRALMRMGGGGQEFDLTKEPWDPRTINEVRRWSDVVLLYHWDEEGNDPHKQYVPRSAITDPFFWQEPITPAWVRELRKILGK